MDLNPYYIKENINDIGLKEGYSLLKDWINNSNDFNLRKEALEVYGQLDNGNSFRFFEQIFLTDEDVKIRLLAAEFLKKNYFNHPKLVSLLEFTLFNEKNIDQKFMAIEILYKLKSRKSHETIKQFLRKTIKKNFSMNKKNFPKDIFKFDNDSLISESYFEICFNIILYIFYCDEKGYNAVLKNGVIILLDCESFNLKDISKIPGFERLTRLEHLLLRRNQISRIKNLDHLKSLKVLDLSENQIQKIENLDKLENLEELKLSMNKIEKIENLNITRVKKLSLDHNLITEIENLNDLINLEFLNLSYNNIREIKNLKGLYNLKSLNLSDNKIEEMSQLESLLNLVTLRLNDNSIKRICCLNRLSELKTLNLSNNLIERIESLQNLTNLTKLELSNNKIKKIEGLDQLIKLQELFLDKNLIAKLEGLEKLKSLIILFLEHNCISEFRIKDIDALKNLNFIFLNENPLTSESRIQYEKKTRLP